MNKQIKQILKITIPFGFGILLIYLFYKKLSIDDIAEMKSAILNAKYGWLAVSASCTIVSQSIRAARWQSLINTMGYNITWFRSFNAISVNYIVNLGIPRAGEIARCGVLATYNGIPINKSIGTLINERILDLIMLFVMGILTLIFQYEIFIQFYTQNLADFFNNIFYWFKDHPIVFAIIVIVSLVLGVLFLRFLGTNTKNKDSKLMNTVNGFKEGILSIVNLEKPLLFILQTLLIWLCYFFMVYFAFKTIDTGQLLGFGAVLSLLFFGTFGFIATPGGIGAYPLITGYLLALYGLEVHLGSTIGWISWTGQTLLILATGLLAFIVLSREKKIKLIANV